RERPARSSARPPVARCDEPPLPVAPCAADTGEGGPVADAELHEDVRDVALDRLRPDAELRTDLAVRHAGDEQLDHLVRGAGQRVTHAIDVGEVHAERRRTEPETERSGGLGEAG